MSARTPPCFTAPVTLRLPVPWAAAPPVTTCRLSSSIASYRVTLLRSAAATPISTTTTTTTTTTPSTLTNTTTLPPSTTTEAPPVAAPAQYTVREARADELYTAADIRCEAFYGGASEVRYQPVRRREIYMAIRSRVSAGTRCIIMSDSSSPNPMPSPRKNAATEDSAIVATLDVTPLRAASGERPRSDVEHHGAVVYISSMAVRSGWRGRKLAQLLLATTVHRLREDGKTSRVYLHVDEENEAAVHVYCKHGFRKVHYRKSHWLHTLAKPEHTLLCLPLHPADVGR